MGEIVLAVLMVLAIGLPPAALAASLREGDAPTAHHLIAGLWLFKALLALNVIVGAILLRRLPRDTQKSAHAWGPIRAMLALLAIGLLLRLPGLGHGLWYDEIQTLVDYVQQPWGRLLTTFDTTNQHLLFSISARLTTSLLGASALALRLPAVLFGVASLGATVTFARRWLPAREAWWSAALLAVSYHHIWFSQNARGYTGLLLGTVVASALFVDMMRGKPVSNRLLWCYAVVMALTILTHATAALVLAGHAACWLWQARHLARGWPRWGPLAALMLAGSVSLMLYAPIILQAFSAVSTSGTSTGAVAWKRPAWFVTEAISGLIRGIPAGIVVVPVAAIILIVGLVSAWRRDRVVTAIMLLPVGAMAALLLMTGHNMWPRFFFFGAAFAVQLAVHGGFVTLGAVIPRHAIRVGDAVLALAVLGSLLLLPRAWAPKQDYPAAVAWVTSHSGPGDVVAGTDMMQLPVVRWLGHDWPIVMSTDSLSALESGNRKVWVVYTFPIRLAAAAPDLWQRLSRGYHVMHVVPGTVGGGEIVIVERDPRVTTQPNP
jgi:mannosyltransferase